MNAPMPSGSDGSLPPIFSDDELRRLRALQPAEPTQQQWDALERRIQTQLQQHPGPTSWHRGYRILLALGLVAACFVGLLGLFDQFPNTNRHPQPVRPTERLPEPAPEPRSLESVDEEPYPIAQSGDVRFISVEPLSGAAMPVLPHANCPNCPVVYAPAQP